MFSKKPRKEDKIRELEKRIEELEKQLDKDVDELKRRTKEEIKDLGESFRTLQNVLKKVQKERDDMENDRDFLIAKHKELIRNIPVDTSKLKKDLREKLLVPLHRKVMENAELVQKAALEDLVPKEEKKDFAGQVKNAVLDGAEKAKTPIDDLFELVMKEGKVKIPDAARKFGVFEAQIEEWSKILESHGLIDIHYSAMGKPELRKKSEQTDESLR